MLTTDYQIPITKSSQFRNLRGFAQKGHPVGMFSVGKFAEEHDVRGFYGFSVEHHACTFGAIIAFGCVAAFASGYEVGPSRLATFGTGDYMVDGEVSGRATILTEVAVSFEDIVATEHHTFERNVDVSEQADNRWHRIYLGNGSERLVDGLGHQLGFVHEDKEEGALNTAHCYGCVILI